MSQNDIDKVRPSDLVTSHGQTNDPIPDNLKADKHADEESVLQAHDAEAEHNTKHDKPAKKGNSNAQTMLVALVLCLVCSVLVAAAAISMKPKQDANILLDRNKNILMAANMFDAEKDDPAKVNELFKNVEIKLINTETGKFATEEEIKAAGIADVGAYDSEKASKNPETGIDLGSDDPAQIGAVAKLLKVYIINDDAGKLKNVVLPINGNGLWGQIYGFLTLKSDLNTIEGISFYKQKETPGLGALITEAKFRDLWKGKTVYEGDKIVTGVVKNGTPKPNPNYVDGITGATLTSTGVNNMIQFWLSERAYKPFLDNLKAGKEN